MKRKKLDDCSREVLADMARKNGIPGWHAMRKGELIEALADAKLADPARAVTQQVLSRSSQGDKNQANRSPASRKRVKSTSGAPKELAPGFPRDRIVVMVRDPYWLQCYWELSQRSIQRAEAALGQDWHSAKPVLRLFDVTTHGTSSTSEAMIRDVPIHGGSNNWYVDVLNPPRSYRVDIGYVSRRGQFYALARSNVVTTPKAGVSDCIDNNLSDLDVHSAERIWAMSSGFEPNGHRLELKQLFEERLRRPLGAPAVTGFGNGAHPETRAKKFFFKLDAELIVYGATEPTAHVNIQGEPIKVRPDGTFTMRFALPDSRQIIPATASAASGLEERTIVLAIERNTKELEPMMHDIHGD